MRPYRTLNALRDGETVNLEGVDFVKDEGPIEKGDWYIAERNSGPELLTASRFVRYSYTDGASEVSNSTESSWIESQEPAYSYDTHECVKVREA